MSQKLDKMLMEEEKILKSIGDSDAEIGKHTLTKTELNNTYEELKPQILGELKIIYAQKKESNNKEILAEKEKISAINRNIETLNDQTTAIDNIISIINANDYKNAIASHNSYMNNMTFKIESIMGLALHPHAERDTQDGFLAKNVKMSPFSKYFHSMQKVNELLLSASKDGKEYASQMKQSLINEWNNYWSTTADRLIWEKFPKAVFVQNYKQDNEKRTELEIPLEGWENIYKFIKEDGLYVMRTMLDNKTIERDEIIETIRVFTDRNQEKQYIGFLNKNNRKLLKESPVLVGFDYLDYFYVDCYDGLSYCGCARGGA